MNLIQLMKYSWVSDELKNIYEAQGAYATNMYLNLLQLRVYPIKLMGDISDAGYFLSVWHILSAGPIHNYG